jgi:uncharacterized ferritin-like protein (DUF455 family)
MVDIELRQSALAALRLSDPVAKCAAVVQLAAVSPAAAPQAMLDDPGDLPGRPERPLLVPPKEVPQRALNTPEGHAALLHALTHIEFNAINLALDACWRFSGMPGNYYQDWLQVATEEARHFALLSTHLATLGFAYGDFPAHDGLWQMAWRTRGDVLARMALVPRTLEARGLDASPAVRRRLAGVGDHAGAAIIDIILRDEIGHVAIGNRWFHQLCRIRDVDPVASYRQLAAEHQAPRQHGPYNLQARRLAGFLPEELAALQRVTAA